MASETRVAVVVVTHDALPWIESCLESLRNVETVVVDNGSRDSTIDFVPAYTFPATANAVELCGARAVLVDVDPDTFVVDPAAVAAAVTPRTRAVMAVHHPQKPYPEQFRVRRSSCSARAAGCSSRSRVSSASRRSRCSCGASRWRSTPASVKGCGARSARSARSCAVSATTIGSSS